MTQEEKNVLLKDLCARAPYGVNIEYTFKVIVIATNTEEIITKPLFLYSINTLDDITVSGIDDDGDETICFLEEVKPFLFPLSSMTEEQKEDYCSLQQKIIYNSKGFANDDIMEYMNWCYKHHLDVNSLIPKGLAIDATGKNIY